MTTVTATSPTAADTATDDRRVAHVPCRHVEHRALCGAVIVGIEAPPEVEKCVVCLDVTTTPEDHPC